MDILKRSLAPITEEAWEEIDEFAKDVITSQLSARKVVDVEGPRGWETSSVSVGRLEVPSGQKDGDVQYGIRMVKPLVEIRVPFELDMWELDNISRGAKDAELAPLEEAAKKAARFEEDAVYKGFTLGSITGMAEEASFKIQSGGKDVSYLGLFAQAIDKMNDVGISGPYSLVVPSEKWYSIVDSSKGYPIERQITELLGGPVVLNQNLDKAYVVSRRGGDFILTLGIDFSLGYDSHTSKSVLFFITETFNFRVLEPRAFVQVEL
ncbi:MAG: family 1 encapsulin nanocompartment shell protein [Spirochaetia bacterium]